MKERPILMAAPMVRQTLAEIKRQTRREARFTANGHVKEPGGHRRWHPDDPGATLACPYGQPGDRLWVRENGWERPERTPKMMRDGADTWAPYYYDADGLDDSEVEDFKRWGFKRRPSIHMPRWASRITLEITGVRLQRLQHISKADCIAEGTPGGHGAIHGYNYSATPLEHFQWLWQKLNGPASWDANPYVWVLDFRKA